MWLRVSTQAWMDAVGVCEGLASLRAASEAGSGAGEEADVAFVAKDAKGFQKSLGGDVFTVSWARAGDDEPATHGMTASHRMLRLPPWQCCACIA